MDKIPIHMLSELPGEETFHCGTITLSKGEYANAEKINQLVDWCRELQEKIILLEGK